MKNIQPMRFLVKCIRCGGDHLIVFRLRGGFQFVCDKCGHNWEEQ